ncbi:ATP-binding protein [Candidatus Aerophobetes bacterium]|nr:ATP-binding protein [Candidatus Aerophobetes bacterium]
MEKIPSSITLKASLENLDKVNRFVHQWSKKVGLSSQSEKDILLAVEEAYVNITKYAYPESTGRVTIYSRIDKDRLIIKIKDEGIPFNPLQFAKAEFNTSLKERKVGGLGIFLMRNFVDGVEYERKGKCNLLTLIKKKSRGIFN